MYKLSNLRIQGFKRLCDMDLKMRPLMVMIGANGAGKTSMLDAFFLLAKSAAGSLNTTLNDLGGLPSLLTCGKNPDMTLSLSLDVPDHAPLRYSLSLALQGPGYAISRETLSQQRPGYPSPFIHIDSDFHIIQYFNSTDNRLTSPNWKYEYTETSLSQVPKMFQQPEAFRRILSSVAQYHTLDVGRDAPVKRPRQMRPANLPGESGEDLVPLLYTLRESEPERYQTIIDTLKVAFPGFEGLNFPPAAAGMISLTWKEKSFSTPIPAHQLSEGTLRFLWLVSLLQSPGLPAVTLIDEPEVSLHPEMLSLLADLFREASERTQLIIATHSDRLIRFLAPREIVVMDIDEDGCATAQWADDLDLERWMQEYTLDELWSMGTLGGRP